MFIHCSSKCSLNLIVQSISWQLVCMCVCLCVCVCEIVFFTARGVFIVVVVIQFSGWQCTIGFTKMWEIPCLASQAELELAGVDVYFS